MFETLTHCFAAVCAQNPGHSWEPAGILLPLCQRCTGLYAGAAVAIWLHLWLRPGLTNRFLEVHGLFLLLMVPCGLHWLAQGPVFRTISGGLFGFGLCTFLWLQVAARWRKGGTGFCFPIYFLCLAATLIMLPVLASHGGRLAAGGLALLAFCGLVGLTLLVFANVVFCCLGALRFLGWRAAASAEP